MTKNKTCKICGKDSGHRTVCLSCKTKYPYTANVPRFIDNKVNQNFRFGNPPYNRRKLFENEVLLYPKDPTLKDRVSQRGKDYV